MEASTTTTIHPAPGALIAVNQYDDPLDPDDATDVVVATTCRGLTRLALVAVETGARFQREGVAYDPMAWMLSPRDLFEGQAALEACLDRDHCLRAIVLHGLSIGFDAAPQTIDALLADAPVDDGPADPWMDGERGPPATGRRGRRRLRLYTATIVTARGGELLHAFHASLAPSAGVIRERIRARFGSTAAEEADIRIGFDPDCPTTVGMIPPAVMSTLSAAARRTRWISPAVLDITVEQRLPS